MLMQQMGGEQEGRGEEGRDMISSVLLAGSALPAAFSITK